MVTSRSFSNYPVAKECPHTDFKHEPDNNPEMKGIPLAVAATLVSNIPTLQRFLWSNAGFGQLKHLPGLDDGDGDGNDHHQTWRFQPTVVQLAHADHPPHRTAAELTSPAAAAAEDDAVAAAAAGPRLRPQPAGLPGRFYSAADYHALYSSGELTPLQVAEALLPLVARGSAHEAAWTACNADEVLADARASTERFAAGKARGLLDGVPFGVKCDTDIAGYVSTVGMKADPKFEFFRRPAQRTVWPVRKLREAGAVMIGHMNMHEIGMDTTGCNPSTGTPINWYNKLYYPGGSSSGAGSSLGAGLVPFAVGTDAGGSIRIPAAFNGVYGLKVSHDRTMVMTSTMCVTGPLAATVADLALSYRIMAQPDPDCPVQGRFAPSVAPPPSARKVIGVCREWVAALADPAVKLQFERTLDALAASAGYEVIDVALPYLREGQIAHAATCLAEAAGKAQARVRRGERAHWADLLNHPNRVLLHVGQHTGATDYLGYSRLRHVIMQHLAFLWEEHPGLLIVSPTTPGVGWKVSPGDQRFGFSDGNASIRNMSFVWLANSSGCPAATAPMGYAEPEQGDGRVPMGIMAMGEWGAEEQLLGWAADIEDYLNRGAENGGYEGGRVRPDGWVDVIGLATGKGTARENGNENENENQNENE